LLNGRVKGFEANQLKGSSDYRHQLESDEFPISDSLFKTFKDFVVNDPTYRLSAAAVDRNRSFIELQLRFNIVTAAYGRVTGDRVFILSGDPQVAKAVDVVPKARDLAQTTVKSKAQP
jgi:hypothetical protein